MNTGEESMQQPIVYAGFWIRMLAFVLDSILQLIVLLPVFYLYFTLNEFSIAALLRLDHWTVLLTMLVILLFWKFRSATPGKILLGMRLVNADTLQPPGLGSMLLRMLGYVVSLLPLGLGFIWIALDRRKQGFHDKLANTVVIIDANLPCQAD